MTTKSKSKAVEPSKAITHIAYQSLTRAAGEALVLDLVTKPKGEVKFMGEEIGLGKRLHRMAMHGIHFDVCQGCGESVDGYTVAQTIEQTRPQLMESHRFILIPTVSGRFVTCDHVMPSTLGGRDTPRNMQVMCQVCNSGKRHELSIADLEHIKRYASEIINPTQLFTAARATVRDHRKAIHAHKTGGKFNGGRATDRVVETLKAELDNIRRIISAVHTVGVSMVPERAEQVARSRASKQLVN